MGSTSGLGPSPPSSPGNSSLGLRQPLLQRLRQAYGSAPSNSDVDSQRCSSFGAPTDVLSVDTAGTAVRSMATVKPMLSTIQLISLTILLAGIQFVWTVELGYGTPYLLSLGVPKPLMSLVWMAGPLSGLIIQPLVGNISDRCTSRLGRRRPFIIAGGLFVIFSVLLIAYAREISIAIAPIALSNPEDGSAEFNAFVSRASIALAVLGFYVLDFSINASQACARALALDIPPLEQQDAGNAYAGRMLNIGSVLGYFVGYLDLRAIVPWHTSSQMQAFCMFAMAVFIVTVSITCVSVRETPLAEDALAFSSNEGCPNDSPQQRINDNGGGGGGGGQQQQRLRNSRSRRRWYSPLLEIFSEFVHLPKPIQRVCNVQFFAWMAWFPFLFYSTTWVADVLSQSMDTNDPAFIDIATRAGSFALFIYSNFSLLCSLLVPMVTCEDTSLADAAADPRGAGARDSLPRPWLRKRWWRGVLRLPSMREMWTMSLLVMSVLLISTYFVRNLTGATVVITLMGLPWAVTMWVPFALVGEFVSLMSGETIEDMAISIQDINSGGRSMSPSLSPAGSRGETSVMDSTDISPHLTPVLSRMSMYNKRSPSLPHHNYHQNDNMPMAKSLLAADANLGRVESQESSTSHIGARRYSAVNHEPTDGVGPDGHPSSTPTTEYDDLISATNTTTNTTDSGVYLGIHNMYIVFPQFAINAISSIVFAILSPDSSASNVHGSLPHVHQPHPSSSSSSSSPSSPPLPQLASLLSSSSPQSSFNIERIDMLLLRVIVGYYQVRRQQNGGGASAGHDAVGWVLRIGGLSAFVSAVLSLFVMNRKQVFDYINSA